jgi:hypothetical protein
MRFHLERSSMYAICNIILLQAGFTRLHKIPKQYGTILCFRNFGSMVHNYKIVFLPHLQRVVNSNHQLTEVDTGACGIQSDSGTVWLKYVPSITSSYLIYRTGNTEMSYKEFVYHSFVEWPRIPTKRIFDETRSCRWQNGLRTKNNKGFEVLTAMQM